MTNDWLHRERMLIGDSAVEKLKSSRVLLFGVGGVGSYVFEALVRAGIGTIAIVDNDTVSETNLNRQLIATTDTIGKRKVDVAEARAKQINPQIEVMKLPVFADESNVAALIDSAAPDYIIDAIDFVPAKIALIREAQSRSVRVVSCMGTGAKLDPSRFKIADISKTHTCPLAKSMRLKLRALGICHCDVLFSDELPLPSTLPSELSSRPSAPGSISFVPSSAGLLLAGFVVRGLM